MNYVILNTDGSVSESSLDDYVQKGSDKANHVKVAFIDSRRDGLSARLACSLPNGSNINVTGTADYFNYKDKNYLGWDIPLALAFTLYAGQVSCSLAVTDSSNSVLVQYPFTITVNESGYAISDESLETRLTVAEYNALYAYIQSIKGDIVTVNSSSDFPAVGFGKTLYMVKVGENLSDAYTWDGTAYRKLTDRAYVDQQTNVAKSYADAKKAEAISAAESYADTKKAEAIQSAKDYSDSEKLPKSEPTLTQMAQSDNAVTSRAFVAQAIAQAIAEADDTHITGMSFTETSRGVWQLTLTRKDTTPLTAQFDIPESMILDTSNPPVLEGHNLILTFQGGSTVSVDMTGLMDVYTGFEGSTITTTVENNVVKATLKQTWVDFLNTAEPSEATRVSNENTRISNEATRQSNESSRASAESTRQNAFESKLNEWEGEFEEKLSEQETEFEELVESAKIDDRKNDGKYRWNIRVSSEGKPQLVYYID